MSSVSRSASGALPSPEAALLSMIRAGSAGSDDAAASIELEDVLEVVDAYYEYTPVAFVNGPVDNAAGENIGACKLVRIHVQYM